MSVEISQRMFSEIMSAFTEVAEMFIMETKNSEKRALFSIKCSRGALSIVDKVQGPRRPFKVVGLKNPANTNKRQTKDLCFAIYLAFALSCLKPQ